MYRDVRYSERINCQVRRFDVHTTERTGLPFLFVTAWHCHRSSTAWEDGKCLDYADDTVLLNGTPTKLQMMTDNLTNIACQSKFKTRCLNKPLKIPVVKEQHHTRGSGRGVEQVGLEW